MIVTVTRRAVHRVCLNPGAIVPELIITNGTDNCAGIKTDADAKNCYVRDVTWENITLYDVHGTMSIGMFYGHGKNETTDCPISEVSDIKIINDTAHRTKIPG